VTDPLVPELLRGDSSEFDATVLVVEDQPAVRNLAAEILADAGCRVITAATGLEALERFEEHPAIDVVLTDVVMPGINGPELAGRLSRHNRQLSVIFMSGYAGDALVGRGIASDAPVLEKPFTAPQLLQAVRRSIDCTPNLAA
jgi:CheY-like chemotaxis protein